MITFQLGKKGLCENFLESLSKTFKNHKLVKISVLKSCTRNRDEIKRLAEKIREEMEKRYNKKFVSKIVGFTIFVIKWQ
ncbi:MAG: YhbY family RNA-binding protein [Candidatus Pacearchaeota archaeon]|nr:YhbY family RNA-binding protein [Candidatus Pacearchaeota archaeon]